MKILIIGVLVLAAMVGHSADMPKTTTTRAPASECGSLQGALECINMIEDLTSLKGDNQNLLHNCSSNIRSYLLKQKAAGIKDPKARGGLLLDAQGQCATLD